MKDDSLRHRLMSEVNLCFGSEDRALEVSKLCAQPLLQSVHAEILRLRVAIASKYRIHKLFPLYAGVILPMAMQPLR